MKFQFQQFDLFQANTCIDNLQSFIINKCTTRI